MQLSLLDVFKLFGFKKPKRKRGVLSKAATKPKNPRIEALRKEAKSVLPQRLEELATEHGFKYNRVAIKNAKTRWGSCSFRNNINLNMHLTRLDDDLIDYVILHELCHTVEKNHSARFWALLQKHLPDAIELRKRLKKVRLNTH